MATLNPPLGQSVHYSANQSSISTPATENANVDGTVPFSKVRTSGELTC